ncbi:PAS domain S-box protein [Fodinibius sp. SL11]|uniref:PAS domain S-box protein n=1 Tax=Fodinibius sp. SL11 TaxID=3425690 RepID=UPI003F880A0B
MDIKNIAFLFADNPNPMWVYDPEDLSIKQANDAACALYGYSKDEFNSLTIADLRPESEIPKLKEEVAKQLDSFSEAGIWKHQKKNGDILYVRVLSHPISYQNNKYKLVTVHDVTNKIQYKHELQLLLEHSLDGIMLTGPDGEIFKANQAACDILGMSEQQIIELGREGIVHKDDKLQEALEKRSRTDEFSGELTFIHRSGRKIPVQLTSSVYTNPQGERRTSLIFRDITERKDTEQKLQDIVDHSTNLFYRHSPDHKLTYVSPQSEEFLGCSPEEAKQKWTKFLTDHPINKKAKKYADKAIKTGQPQPPYDLQLKKKTGEKIWVRVNEAPVVEDGKTIAIVGSLTDITEQRRYEEQLQETLERYKYVTKATNDAIYEWDIEDDSLFLGEAFSDLFGHDPGSNNYTLDEYTQFVHPEDHSEAQESLDRTLEDPSKHYWKHEYRFKKSDGEYAHVVENGYIIHNEDGDAIRMIGALRDVTEQRDLEQLLEQAYRIGRIGAWELDLETETLYWSPITKELHEVNPDFEPDIETAINFYKEGENRTTIKEAVEQATADGTPWDEELQIVTANGNERWVRSKGEPEIVDGQCQRVYGVFQDINDRKKREQELKKARKKAEESEARYRTLFENMNTGFVLFEVVLNKHDDPADLTILAANKAFAKTTGLNLEEAIGKRLTKVLPGIEKDEADWIGTYSNVALTGKTTQFEEGSELLGNYYNISAFPAGPKQCAVTFLDITDRKRYEMKLAESEERLRLATEQADIAVWEYDFNTNSMSRSRNHDQLYGLEWQDKWDINTFLNATHPEDREYSHSYIQNAVAPGGPDDYSFDFRVGYPDGSIHWLSVTGRVIERDEGGQGMKVRGTLTDITEQKEREKQLREINRKDQLILESTAEGIYGLDTEGKCTFINNAASNMLGYRAEECIGKNMHELIHYKYANGEHYPESECPIFISKNNHESCRVTDDVFWRADGSCFDVEYTSSPMVEDGEIMGAVIAFSDITERKQHERALHESLKEKDTLLAEIHHRVKNNLAVVSSMMQLQAFDEDDQVLRQKLTDSVSRIQTMGTIHELLYQSNSLSSVEFGKNIRKLVTNIAETFQPKIDLDISYDLEETKLNINQAVPVSLIINEVITNVFKHAFDEKDQGTLRLEMKKESDTVTLQISDNGKGLPPDFQISKNASSLGLQLIDTLSQQLEGDYRYESDNGKTHFKLTFQKRDTKGSGSSLLT